MSTGIRHSNQTKSLVLFFCSMLQASDDLSVTQKLLLREKASLNPFYWDDHDLKTIATLRCVNKELRDNIDKVRNKLFTNFPNIGLTKSTIVFNQQGEWCCFSKNKNKEIRIFFGNNVNEQYKFSLNGNFAFFNIEPITSGVNTKQSSFYIDTYSESTRYFIVNPIKKRVYTVWYDTKKRFPNVLIESGFNFKKFSHATEFIAEKFGFELENSARNLVPYWRSWDRVPEQVSIDIDFDNVKLQNIFINIEILNTQDSNHICSCIPEHIKNECRHSYEAIDAILQEKNLKELSFILRRNFIQKHMLHPISANAKKTKTFFVNPYGEIFVKNEKHGALHAMHTAQIATASDSAPSFTSDEKYIQRAKVLAQQFSVIRNILYYYSGRGNSRTVHLLCFESQDNARSLNYKVYTMSLSNEYAIIDAATFKGNEKTMCAVLLARTGSRVPYMLAYCDIVWDVTAQQENIEPAQNYTTIEQVRKHFYDNVLKSGYPVFYRKLIEAPSAVLTTMIHDIGIGYCGPIKQLSLNTIRHLRLPIYSQEELLRNSDTEIKFKPKNLFDRLWYTVCMPIIKLPRDLNRNYFYGACLLAGLVGFVGNLFGAVDQESFALAQQSVLFLTFGISSGHHFLKNDEAKCRREFSRFGKMWPYPLICIASYMCLSGSIPRLLYAATPLWFTLYDRLCMFIAPSEISVPFSTLYNSFPARIYRKF